MGGEWEKIKSTTCTCDLAQYTTLIWMYACTVLSFYDAHVWAI